MQKTDRQGLHPIAIRIIKDRKPTYIYTGYSVKKTDWDEKQQRVKKSYPNSARLNNLLLTRLTEASGKAIELETEAKTVSSKTIKRRVKNTATELSFGRYAKQYTDNFEASGKYNRLNPEQSRIKNFKAFLNDADISLREIDEALLTKFAGYLLGKKKLSERTVMNHFIAIRAIYNLGMKDHPTLKVNYPFGNGKITIRLPESTKIGLEPNELAALENVDLSDQPKMQHCRNLWLFSFYLAGIRVSDLLVLRWKDFQGDRLYYQMGKNLKALSLKLPEKAIAILEQYRPQGKFDKNSLVFPDLLTVVDFDDNYEVERKTSYAVKRIDQWLQKIAKRLELNKDLTMHIARHTFASLAGDKVPIQMLSKLYRHSSITTTIGYQANFIHKEADEALEAVLAL